MHPATPSAIRTPPGRTSNPTRPPGGLATPIAVLVVDDDPDILQSLREILAAADARLRSAIWTARSGEDALALVKRQSFDLILSDLHMGRMDGVTFLTEAQRIQPSTNSILMSGDRDLAGQRLLGSAIQHTTFLAKPFDPLRLIALVLQRLNASRVAG